MWIVYWKVNGKSGNGKPIPLALAGWACDLGNSRHGAGTHWMEEA